MDSPETGERIWGYSWLHGFVEVICSKVKVRTFTKNSISVNEIEVPLLHESNLWFWLSGQRD